ncbi:hypothetical protein GLOIN_2v1785592 [Rhizophagus irregularis DAOM 181602=DAOM 197198]|uniref:Uncharacterized protein n=1 Tax=Rhizophagus irregularis (strain DAOM 181602 / DAOM 197198 / MUCL 43194) TaxID=747089 RepID=A0A2P4PA12_RHIID|nr:hypothetical protein GLOIN_2v1785592 [Rhizophagus irregularis DAOM 181602=DAOM 197198]POG62201.1 hypothetical protein GLOIN_2v1785592 [Rhizophagus irregularis DAOM 181602=DAOM 197198]|eukprot:XP_025169067.1 hypothetical protein GLOIN_2v1785592 [Rhizophagus irregularis DAOM 181602=DAOM 197198]
MSKFSYMRTWILNLKVTFERRLNLKLATLAQKNVRLSNDEINIHIAETFKETDEDDNDDLTLTHKSTGSEKIPKDNCYILIEPVWINKFIDLSHDLIIKDINVLKDLLDDFDENMNNDNTGRKVKNQASIISNDAGSSEDDNKNGKGYYNYNVDDLLYIEISHLSFQFFSNIDVILIHFLTPLVLSWQRFQISQSFTYEDQLVTSFIEDLKSNTTSTDFVENLIDKPQVTLQLLLSELTVLTWKQLQKALSVTISEGNRFEVAFSTAKTAINVALKIKTDEELIKILKDFIAAKYEKQSERNDYTNNNLEVNNYIEDQLTQDTSNIIIPYNT